MNTEKERYIEKLEKQIDAIKRILKMDSGTVLDSHDKDNLRKLKEEAEHLYRKLKTDEFEIAIVGLEKAGKSTFANALMRKRNLLPTDDQRCTFTSTKIEYPQNGESEGAEVAFYSSNEFNHDFQDKLLKLGIHSSDRYSYDTLSEADFEKKCEAELSPEQRKIYSDLIEDIKNIIKYQTSISQLLDNPNREFMGNALNELAEFITSPKVVYAVKSVRIRSNALEHMPNAVVYDVPGFNSPTELHKIQTRQRMKSADAIVMVANGSQPSITSESMRILQESDDDGNLLSDKLFVFANKIDLSNDIKKNIDITYEQWISKNHFLSDSQRDRIVFGSALLYLEELYNTSGLAKRALDDRYTELPNGDGIEEIRKRMAAYNKTDRLEVLKKRINRLQNELAKIFDNMHSQYGESSSSFYTEQHMALIQQITREVPVYGEKNLRIVMDELKRRFSSDKPLSNKIIQYIEQDISVDAYQITESEIEEARLESGVVDLVTEVDKIESKLREKRMRKMYDDFSSNVIHIADYYHAEYTGKILDSLLEAMGVHSDSPFYSELYASISKELQQWRGGEDDSSSIHNQYQSLIERFSRDIYEILIYYSYSPERLRKFYKTINNFFALSVFYHTPDSTDKLAYIHMTPEEQPLCKMLLFHGYRHFSDIKNQLIMSLQKVTGFSDETIQSMESEINKVIQQIGEKTDAVLDKTRKEFERLADKSDHFKMQVFQNILHGFIANNNMPSLANEKEFTEYYKAFHGKRHEGLSTIEGFCGEFNADLDILRDVLENAFVAAIDIDGPFVKREVKSIEDIIDYLKGNAFADFLRLNLRKIKSDEVNNIDQNERIRRQNADIAREVDSILQTLNGKEE